MGTATHNPMASFHCDLDINEQERECEAQMVAPAYADNSVDELSSESTGPDEGEDLMVIQYTSQLSMSPEAAHGAMRHIVDHAQRANIAKDITGVVLLNEGTQQIFQILEGPVEEVSRT